LHDIVTLDNRGVPGCFVASEEFKPAAAAQGKALGFEPAVVWLEHPIQNRSEQELIEIANDSVDEIIGLISGD